MTIKEFLKDYISNNAFEQIALCTKLKNEIYEGAKLNSGWEFFIKLLENTEYGQDLTLSIQNPLYHPENINRLCTKLFGRDNTPERLLSWLDSFNNNKVNTEGLIDLFNPKININITDFPLLALNKINAILNEQVSKENDCLIRPVDSEHRLVLDMHLGGLLKACPYDRLKYIAEARDCDDFAFMLKGWLAQQGLGNLTIGYAEINCYDQNPDGTLTFSFAHACNLAITQGVYGELLAEYIEPQTDKTWFPKDPMPWGWGEKIVKLRYLMI